MSNEGSPSFNQTGSIRFTKRTLTLILVGGFILASGPAWYMFFNSYGSTELASGGIIPMANAWFVVSNWLCANACFLYARNHLPLWFIVLGWFGLAGGGTDHLIEVFTYYNGNHAPFAHHWADMNLFGVPMVWFPFVAFGITSLMGIYGMVYVYVRYAKNASIGPKIFCAVLALAGGIFAMVIEPMFIPHSTVSWYATHIFIVHAFLSMLPVYIVWHFASHINVFSLVPRTSQGFGISPNEVLGSK